MSSPSACEPLIPFPNSFGKATAVVPRASRGRRDKQRFYRAATERSSNRAPSGGCLRFGSVIRVMRWQTARPGRFFSDHRRTAVVGRRQAGKQLFISNRLMVQGEIGEPFYNESPRRIDLGERFLRRRFSGCMNPFLPADLFRFFFEKICLDQYRHDLSLFGSNTCGAAADVRP